MAFTFKQQDVTALTNATSLSQLRAAQQKLIAAKTQALPMEDGRKWQHWQNIDAAAQQRVSSYAQRIQSLDQQAQTGSKSAAGQMLAIAKMSDGDIKSLQGQVGRYQTFLDNQVNSNGLDPDSDQAKQITTKIDEINGQIATATQMRGQRNESFRRFDWVAIDASIQWCSQHLVVQAENRHHQGR